MSQALGKLIPNYPEVVSERRYRLMSSLEWQMLVEAFAEATEPHSIGLHTMHVGDAVWIEDHGTD